MVHNREAFVSCMHSVIFTEKKCYQRSVSITKLISCAGIILDIIAWALCGCVILVFEISRFDVNWFYCKKEKRKL